MFSAVRFLPFHTILISVTRRLSSLKFENIAAQNIIKSFIEKFALFDSSDGWNAIIISKGLSAIDVQKDFSTTSNFRSVVSAEIRSIQCYAWSYDSQESVLYSVWVTKNYHWALTSVSISFFYGKVLMRFNSLLGAITVARDHNDGPKQSK